LGVEIVPLQLSSPTHDPDQWHFSTLCNWGVTVHVFFDDRASAQADDNVSLQRTSTHARIADLIPFIAARRVASVDLAKSMLLSRVLAASIKQFKGFA
jgi:hypothetical protein